MPHVNVASCLSQLATTAAQARRVAEAREFASEALRTRRRLHSQIEIASALAMSGRIERQVAVDSESVRSERVAAVRSALALYEDAADVLRKLVQEGAQGKGGVAKRKAPSQDSRHLRMLLEVLQALRALRKLRTSLGAADAREHGGDNDRSLAAELKRVQARLVASASTSGGRGGGGGSANGGDGGAPTTATNSPVRPVRHQPVAPALKEALERRRQLREALKTGNSEDDTLSVARSYASNLSEAGTASSPTAAVEAASAFSKALATAKTSGELWSACDALRKDCRVMGIQVVD